MKDMGVVQGSKQMAVPLYIGKDTVYEHFNIEEIEDNEGNLIWQYNEIQYDKDEYIQLMSERNDSLEKEVLNTQLAIAELVQVQIEEQTATELALTELASIIAGD